MCSHRHKVLAVKMGCFGESASAEKTYLLWAVHPLAPWALLHGASACQHLCRKYVLVQKPACTAGGVAALAVA